MLRLILVSLCAIVLPLAPAKPELVRRYKAPEARQGVAVDATHFYAIGNSVIAKYARDSGRKLGEWRGGSARFPHLNACSVIESELVCASSNYPKTPMRSSVEIFDPARMVHLRSIQLGEQGGSLTWIERRNGAWFAGFANYDGRGGEKGRGHAHSKVVKFDEQWRELGSWRFPGPVLERFRPWSTSGGAFGPDGLLYVTGHDRQELYVLALPQSGNVLEHRATLDVAFAGQSIAFDPAAPDDLFGISRARREVIVVRLSRNGLVDDQGSIQPVARLPQP